MPVIILYNLPNAFVMLLNIVSLTSQRMSHPGLNSLVGDISVAALLSCYFFVIVATVVVL